MFFLLESMQTDYYEKRYPFVFHRCRWQHNLALVIELSSYILEPLKDEHTEELFSLLSNPEFSGFYDEFRSCKHKLMEALEKVVVRGGHFVIRSKKERKLSGELIILEEEKEKWEVSYWLNIESQGKGIMSEILNEFIDWVFSNTELFSLYARCKESNISSRRVLEKCGFNKEKISGEMILMKRNK